MTKKTNIFPEDVLIATLHQVHQIASGIRIPNDQQLAAIFNDAAQKHRGVFQKFAWNPLYKHSTVLSDALQHIDLGGAIVRENAPTSKMYFTITTRTMGDYGKEKFQKFSRKEQVAVKEVARRIRDEFDKPIDPAEADREGGRRQSAGRSHSLV
ncbi:MAG TPA: hypothetical protein VIM11_09690 [Tepidisphaeraceae bacterium]|jgi:hypothetical protein